MKHLKTLKGLLLTLLLICTSTVFAHDFEKNGIYYNILSESDKTVEVTYGDNDYIGSVVIKESVTYDGITYRVTRIGSEAFSCCGSLTSIKIPNSVTDIRREAFYGCSSLISIEIPNSVTGIGSEAFYGCSSLISIEIPNSVTSIGGEAFRGCSSLISIEIPNSVTSIGGGAFRGCSSLISIEIPNSVTSIVEWTFSGCSSLASIKIGNGVKRIGEWAFSDCSSLTSIEIPNSVTSIEDLAFLRCGGLKSVIIGNGVKSIGNDVFNDCRGLANVIIGNSVRSIGVQAFLGCSSLTSIEISNSVTSIGYYAFGNCSNLTSIKIPNSITSIGGSAFVGCNKLENIYFRSNPQIGNNAIPSTAKCHLILEDSNAIDFDITNVNTYADVSYSRTISEGKFGTIILPFAPNAASLENYAFFKLAECGVGYMKFEEVTIPVANTPYIYTLREGKENVAITGAETTISSTVETPVVDGWQTIGSFTNQALDTSDGNYYAFSPSKNEINKITKNLTVLPYRAYFKSDNASKSAFSVYISRTTGVKEVLSSEIDGFETEVVYDLSGRKILDPVRGGIYIINGKKVKF